MVSGLETKATSGREGIKKKTGGMRRDRKVMIVSICKI